MLFEASLLHEKVDLVELKELGNFGYYLYLDNIHSFLLS